MSKTQNNRRSFLKQSSAVTITGTVFAGLINTPGKVFATGTDTTGTDTTGTGDSTEEDTTQPVTTAGYLRDCWSRSKVRRGYGVAHSKSDAYAAAIQDWTANAGAQWVVATEPEGTNEPLQTWQSNGSNESNLTANGVPKAETDTTFTPGEKLGALVVTWECEFRHSWDEICIVAKGAQPPA